MNQNKYQMDKKSATGQGRAVFLLACFLSLIITITSVFVPLGSARADEQDLLQGRWWQRHQQSALLQGRWWQHHLAQNRQQPAIARGLAPVALSASKVLPALKLAQENKVVPLAAVVAPRPLVLLAKQTGALETAKYEPAPGQKGEQGSVSQQLLTMALMRGMSKEQASAASLDHFTETRATTSIAKKLDLSGLSRPLAARLAAKGFTPGSPVFMRIFKDRSQLEIWLKKGERFALYRSFKICRWAGRFGPKLYEGDNQSPEGFYLVDDQLFNRHSWKWKNSFSIGYPNAYDKLHGRTGSLILVHGGCTSSGCFAMTNPVISEVHELARLARKNGQDRFNIHVLPFKLTSANLRKHKNSQWLPFWENLKQGYDLFEKTGLPPSVSVCRKKYVFNQSSPQDQSALKSGDRCYGLASYVPGWRPARRMARSRRHRVGRYLSTRARRAGVHVRCDVGRASCRRWIALRSGANNRAKAQRRTATRRANRRSATRRAATRRAATRKASKRAATRRANANRARKRSARRRMATRRVKRSRSSRARAIGRRKKK